LARNASAEAMRVKLKVRRGDAFHVDGPDLLSAKARGRFVAEASNELGLATDAIKRDIGQALLALEGAQEEMLATTMANPPTPRSAPVTKWQPRPGSKAPGLTDRQ
jgi:hypothetical protein